MKTHKVTIAFRFMEQSSEPITHINGGDLFILLAKTFMKNELKNYSDSKKMPHVDDIMKSFNSYLDRDGVDCDIIKEHNEEIIMIEQ